MVYHYFGIFAQRAMMQLRVGLNGVKILWFEAPEIAECSDYFPACGVHLGQHTFLPK
jgi:hypothetical protein